MVCDRLVGAISMTCALTAALNVVGCWVQIGETRPICHKDATTAPGPSYHLLVIVDRPEHVFEASSLAPPSPRFHVSSPLAAGGSLHHVLQQALEPMREQGER